VSEAAAPAPASTARVPLTWVEIRCTRCGCRHFVILEHCLRFGFPPCRRVQHRFFACQGEMAILGQSRASVAKNGEGLVP
jgi:hypothetical protein